MARGLRSSSRFALKFRTFVRQPCRDPRRHRPVRHFDPVDQHLPAVRPLQPDDRLGQFLLPVAVHPSHRDDLAGTHCQPHRLEPPDPAPVGEPEPPHLEHRPSCGGSALELRQRHFAAHHHPGNGARLGLRARDATGEFDGAGGTGQQDFAAGVGKRGRGRTRCKGHRRMIRQRRRMSFRLRLRVLPPTIPDEVTT